MPWVFGPKNNKVETLVVSGGEGSRVVLLQPSQDPKHYSRIWMQGVEVEMVMAPFHHHHKGHKGLQN